MTKLTDDEIEAGARVGISGEKPIGEIPPAICRLAARIEALERRLAAKYGPPYRWRTGFPVYIEKGDDE